MVDEGWTADTVERFEDALALLAAGNAKALRLSMSLAQVTTLEEKHHLLAAWRTLANSMTQSGGVAATPEDLPKWVSLDALFEEWTQREGVPAVLEGKSRGD
jgi:hypothetical protein